MKNLFVSSERVAVQNYRTALAFRVAAAIILAGTLWQAPLLLSGVVTWRHYEGVQAQREMLQVETAKLQAQLAPLQETRRKLQQIDQWAPIFKGRHPTLCSDCHASGGVSCESCRNFRGSVADEGQDAVLLVDVGGVLVVDANGASERGWEYTVRRVARGFDRSFLLALSGYGDADMINYFDEAGRRIPEEISVVGFDDIPESPYFMPPLTTVRQDFGEVGSRSLCVLVRTIESVEAGERPPTGSLVPPELVVRASTAVPPAMD